MENPVYRNLRLELKNERIDYSSESADAAEALFKKYAQSRK